MRRREGEREEPCSQRGADLQGPECWDQTQVTTAGRDGDRERREMERGIVCIITLVHTMAFLLYPLSFASIPLSVMQTRQRNVGGAKVYTLCIYTLYMRSLHQIHNCLPVNTEKMQHPGKVRHILKK